MYKRQVHGLFQRIHRLCGGLRCHRSSRRRYVSRQRSLGFVLPAPDDAAQLVHSRRVEGITGRAELKSKAGIAKSDPNGGGLRPFTRRYRWFVGLVAAGCGRLRQVLLDVYKRQVR